VNFNRLIEGLEKILRRLIREDIDIELSFAADLGWVKADPGQLEQILLNLMVNARDAMPTGGKITIETANAEFDRQFVRSHDGAVAGSYVMFAVKDSGAGMSKEVKARIFEPFFTTKERERGTGLGLATVYGIIKQTGGYILVDSRPGEGSTFRVYLPRTEESPATFANSIPCSEIRGTGTLMVVEDQRDVLNLVEQTLRECGFSVLTAGNPEEALRRLDDEAETIDLLLTDIVMPGLSGPQLADRLKKSHPELKVLFMSGYGQFEGKNRFVAEKGTAFLAKPFSPRALVTKVHELLGIGVAEAESSTSAATP
jgi:two-component system cell cycle sensor histidine kinase/response regulator CckA